MNDSCESENRQIARATGTVMAAFVLSNLTGLIRQILVAKTFGTQSNMDAFNAANRVSETLFNLVAGGALSSAFIPTFSALLTLNNRERAWKLASSIGNLIFILSIIIGLIASVFAPWIVRNILAPGFAENPELLQLTVKLMRLMMPSAVIFGLSGLIMGILNSHQSFLFPALAPAMYQVGMILGLSFLTPSLGIFGLAWGVLLGAILHLALQLPVLFNLKGSYFRSLNLDSPDVREVARLMGPRLLGVAVVQINFWINTRLASDFSEGSVTGIVLGFTLMLMPQAAIAQSMAIAALPTFSAQIARGRINEMRHSLSTTLRSVIFLSLPASVGLIILRKPIIQILYERGKFDERSTELVAWALLFYAMGLVAHAIVEIFSRGFYSLHDTRTPVTVGVVAMSLNIGFSYLFSSFFLRLGLMPHGGLALANTVATALEAIGLLVLMRKRINGLEYQIINIGLRKTIAATVIMAGSLAIWMVAAQRMPVWLEAIGGMIIGIFVFSFIGYLLKIEEIGEIIRMLERKI